MPLSKAEMSAIKRAKRYGLRNKRTGRKLYPRKRRGARPMRALPHSYKGMNTHRFVRETLPLTLPFSIITAGTSFPAMGYLEFANLQFNQLVQATPEFGALFARYKVDKIETILTPMFQETVATTDTSAYNNSGGLRITRINTKYFNGPISLGTTSDAVLGELAQIQSKSVTPYASKKSLKIVTYNPYIVERGVVDSTNTEISTAMPAPWLNINNQSDVPFKHNSVLFAERVDGGAVNTNWKYRMVHRVTFRVTQVG